MNEVFTADSDLGKLLLKWNHCTDEEKTYIKTSLMPHDNPYTIDIQVHAIIDLVNNNITLKMAMLYVFEKER